MPPSILIRPAIADEATLLSELARRSKGHWGYPEEFLEACREELTVDPEQTSGGRYDCVVAEIDGTIAGFYALEALSATVVELDALFVEPEHIGRGIGRKLMQDAIRTTAARGAGTLLIQGDPHAVRFYEAAGGRQTGIRESDSIPGRYLPVFEVDVSA